jgi:hypothetical protein
MHDIDRTQAESIWGEVDGFEPGETGYLGEYEAGEYGYMGEQEQGFYGERGDVYSESDELQLAAELLGVSNEAELDQFIGDLFKAAKRAIRSPVGRAVGGMLKGVARQALPMVGSALGNMYAPGLGGAVGSQLASSAGSMLGLELEGLSPEDQEFEIARQVVRLGGEAINQAATAPPGVSPQVVAQKAIQAAAQQYAPGLVSQVGMPGRNGSAAGGGRHTGRWFRRGNRIVLVGV